MSVLSTPPEGSAAAHASPIPRSFVCASQHAARQRVFLTASAVLYVVIVLASVLTLNPYFAQTWDVATFVQAAHRFLDGGNPFDLYAASRAGQTWPYAYPPLHALAVAVTLVVGQVTHLFPEYVWARVPALAADIGVGVTLFALIRRRTGDDALASIALLLWLFNPVTFYDTAVQGHFESEWLLFVLLAYAWYENKSTRAIALSTTALALAVLFKQIAILYALPVWMYMLVRQEGAFSRNWARAGLSLAAFGAIVGAVCLPYLLYSNDFMYMNLTYVENVPVQTQSWIVALLGWTRSAPDALVSGFFLLRYQTPVTIIATAAIAFWGARRGLSLYFTGALIAIAFFLTSKKVMGYYYVMLLPFLIAEFLPRRRFDIVLSGLLLTSWIALMPYYAGWVNHAHWWVYALGGVTNSVLFVVLAGMMMQTYPTGRPSAKTVLLVVGGSFAAAAGAALLQPLVQSSSSPIRAPLVADGMAMTVGLVFALFLGLLALVVWGLNRAWPEYGAVEKWAWGIALVFAPLVFAVYTLTKESTAVLEMALHALGI